jgi:RimJ/RimL family protein N-acetyltransferase
MTAIARIAPPAHGHWPRPTGEANEEALGIAHRTYVVTPLAAPFRADVAAHLLELDTEDRAMRFGHAVRDRTIETYVAGMHFARDVVLGAHDTRLRLIGVAHLVFTGEAGQAREAEFGVSVRHDARGRGVGCSLFQAALGNARRQAVHAFSMHIVADNTAMLRIARRAGMTLHREYGEVRAVLDPRVSGLPSV